ncbi:ADP-ribosylglycohydrolase family protein [Streptomyces sp. NBC_00638]|uniref:ADP-ribosylglycohydrolase family protein n=1 Tax=Streptomyces sp. NBC_00638 TaxID=2975794 RepID=UPI0022519E5B|nr:ADP-ribosylglycohydrolase family protein [Streptomyces sp. NBC_00638]MCX5003173.1 ADP-ribosylglycohydrolase family protein [Streptomyces sp. NBC_00638]
MLRLTWVQPEDLLGHELHQAVQDGREPAPVAARWRAAGGRQAPLRAGASTTPASPSLRRLAADLLDELAALPRRLADDEPTDLALIKAACPSWPPPRYAPVPAPDRARLEAAWLGRAVGCLLGKPVEKLPLHGIRALARASGNWPLRTWFTARGVPQDLLDTHPWNRRSAPTSLAENIDGMPEDDDLNYPLLNLLLLQRHGRDFTTADVASLWLDELPAGRTFTAERVAYRNLLSGVEPPETARRHNPFREWIGALIRADVHGWTNPGDPAGAAEQAYRDAALTHTANGVYAAMFAAAVIAEAATGASDVHACLRTGLTVVPPGSRLARAVRHAVQLARTTADFDTVVDELHATHRDCHWVHAVPNTALIAAALTHADGDFGGSVCRAVSGGLDTDSNGATAGSVAGLLAGDPAALPDHWTSPLKNRLATSVADFDGIGFDALAHLTHRETVRP